MVFDKEYFDAGLYRVGTRCEKWDGCRTEHGADALPLWVADMDFPSPPAVTEALLRRAAHPTYGYTQVLDDDRDALISFWQRRHGLTMTRESIMLLPCVVSGMRVTLNALTQPGDGVIITSPVYGPFRFSIAATGRKLMDCPMLCDEEGRYSFDYAAIENALNNGAKAMILCNPHNPVSRMWTREELVKLIDLIRSHGAYLISDEIHADFELPGFKFTPALSIETKGVVSLCAPSKTFNLAGLQFAYCVALDEEIREKVKQTIESSGVVAGNIFGLEASRAAYNEGEAWLDGLLTYVGGNVECFKALLAEHLPKAKLTPMEATYLAWLDVSAYGFKCDELAKRTEAAGVIFTGGAFFGEETGEYHLRFNLACPRRYLEEGVLRLKKALEA